MSEVTNLILTCSSAEKEIVIRNEIEKFKNRNLSISIVSVDNDMLPKGWYGGTKYLESIIFLGAYNYLDLENFIKHLKLIQWEYPESVQLIVRKENEDRFEMINLFG